MNVCRILEEKGVIKLLGILDHEKLSLYLLPISGIITLRNV